MQLGSNGEKHQATRHCTILSSLSELKTQLTSFCSCRFNCKSASSAVMLNVLLSIVSLAVAVLAHEDHEQTPIAGPHKGLWYNTLPGDGGTQVSCFFKQANSIRLNVHRLIPFSRVFLPLDVYHTLHA